MIRRIDNLLGQVPRPILVVLGLAAVPVLGSLDYLTGYEISFAFFYLIPVSFFAWFIGRDAALVVSLLSAVTWQTSNILAGESLSSSLIFVWNASTRLGFFLVVTVLLSRLRIALTNERKLSRTDFLTGALNRRAFYDAASIEALRSRRHARPLTVAYIDLDNFKAVNDRLGHDVGDALLSAVAKTIAGAVRKTDAVARLGGDEFAVLLPETGLTEAREPLTRMRDRLQRTMDERGWPVTFSIGVLSCPTPPITTEEMVREADRVMYGVKRSGKNAILYESYDGASPQ